MSKKKKKYREEKKPMVEMLQDHLNSKDPVKPLSKESVAKAKDRRKELPKEAQDILQGTWLGNPGDKDDKGTKKKKRIILKKSLA